MSPEKPPAFSLAIPPLWCVKGIFSFSKKVILVTRRPQEKGQEDKAELEKRAGLPLHWS